MTLNYHFLEFMKQGQNKLVEERFRKELHPELNKRIKNNFYSLDDLGIPIRSSEHNHKTVFGWLKTETSIYHFKVNTELLDVMSEEDLRLKTLRLIKASFPSEFVAKGKMRQLLIETYGEDYFNEI